LKKRPSDFKLIPESPRWLLVKGRLVDAERIIRKAAKDNGRKLPMELHLSNIAQAMRKEVIYLPLILTKQHFPGRRQQNSKSNQHSHGVHIQRWTTATPTDGSEGCQHFLQLVRTREM
jgi:hypothetical protein